MDIIYKLVITVLLVVSVAISGSSIVAAEMDVNSANNYFDDLASVISESNYNQNVIDDCVAEASANGYTLTVNIIGSPSTGTKMYAEMELEYKYEIPLFGVSEVKTKHKII